MLKQDESVYQTNSNPNSQFCLEKAFRDSHALLNVPGKSWVGPERGTMGIKEESATQEIIDSLQQIFGDNSMSGTLEELTLDQEELKEWENALLRMNSMSSTEMSVEISDILANDIFTYVEDVLFKECSPNTNDQLPQCLSELQLQGDLNDLLGISEGLETGGPGSGMKLAHIEPEISLGQQLNPVEPFAEICESMIYDSSLSGQQNQASLVQQTVTGKQTQAELGLQVQDNIQSGNLGYVENMALPNLHNHQAQNMGFHNHRSVPLSQAIQPSSQWAGLQPPSSENISLSQNVLFNHAPNAYHKGKFSLSNQSVDNQTLETWKQPHLSVQQGHPQLTTRPKIPKVPNIKNIPNGHHHHVQPVPGSRLIPQSNFGLGTHPQPNVVGNPGYGQQGGLGHPSDAVFGQPGERMQTINAVYGQQRERLHPANAMFGQQDELMEMSNAPYNQQEELSNNVTSAPSSCMFEKAMPAPMNGPRYGPGGQEAKEFLGQNSVQGSYIFQNRPSESVLNNHLQQQFLTCNSQTQVTLEIYVSFLSFSCYRSSNCVIRLLQITNCPVKENGAFQFGPVMGGTPCFTNKPQNDSF